MSAETQAKIFDTFFTTKPSNEGSGLGMCVVLGVVEQHDGFIDVSSELGVGTTVSLFLPQSDAGEN